MPRNRPPRPRGEPVRRHTPLFRVWDPLNNEESDAADRWEYGALDVKAAAEVHARYRWSPDDLAERNWPITFRVRELDTGKVFDVSVSMELVPEYRGGEPEEIE